MFVLANTIRIKNYDGRISSENKAWAQTIPICEAQRNIIVDRCNPGLLDLFTNQVRKDFAVEQARSQQKASVREKLHANTHYYVTAYCVALSALGLVSVSALPNWYDSAAITVWMLILAISIGVFALELWKLFKDSAKRLECVSLK